MRRSAAGPGDPCKIEAHGIGVLTLAQRTADALMSAAHRHAEGIRKSADVEAHRIILEARLDANRVQAEAETALTEARAAAEQMVHRATIETEKIRKQAAELLTAAREQAALIIGAGQARAETLKNQAEQQFEESVGKHGVRRAALQQQIEALELFDRECRRQLTGVFQSQLRALWVPLSPAGDGRPAAPRGCRPLRHHKQI
jgi:cell division septum initiation protein DivIVA